jgi:hypothetical protein
MEKLWVRKVKSFITFIELVSERSFQATSTVAIASTLNSLLYLAKISFFYVSLLNFFQ